MNMQTTDSNPASTGGEDIVRHDSSAWGRRDVVALLLLGLLAFTLWIPRLDGPIDLRYDSGVYYLLGTSIAQGKGYRILSEPGEPVGVQYPPALPTFVAAHQWALGTDDPITVGSALRISFCVLSVIYTLAVYVMARQWIGPLASALGSLLCTMYFGSYYYSDMLFTDVPCGLAAVLFVICLRWTSPLARGVTTTALAWLAFLLRTAGIALLAAWVGEALLRRQWKSAAIRAGLAAVPFVLWQGHVMLTERSEAYQNPAFEYQRADYMFYNVSYANNAKLIDPFQPELGYANSSEMLSRVGTNLLTMPMGLGEAASNPIRVLGLSNNVLHKFSGRRVPAPLLYAMVLIATGLIVLGLIRLARQRRWGVPVYVMASIALICLTPWPGQFSRYLTPVTPLLTVLLAIGVSWAWSWARSRPHRYLSYSVYAMLGVTVASIMASQFAAAAAMYKWQTERIGVTYRGREARTQRFYYGQDWHSFEDVIAWVDEHAGPEDLVATASPHKMYLSTGVKSIMPPFENDPVKADRLLRDAGVTYVVLDNFGFVSISPRYARPAIQQHPAHWELVYTVPAKDMQIYRRVDPSDSNRLQFEDASNE